MKGDHELDRYKLGRPQTAEVIIMNILQNRRKTRMDADAANATLAIPICDAEVDATGSSGAALSSASLDLANTTKLTNALPQFSIGALIKPPAKRKSNTCAADKTAGAAKKQKAAAASFSIAEAAN